MDAASKIGFGEDGQRVLVTDFDYAAVDPGAAIEDLRAENENLRRDISYIKSKPSELLDFFFGVLTSENLPAKQLKNRVYLFEWLVGRSSFATQVELARILGISPAAVNQQLNSLCSQFPLLARLRAD
jgi:hypothetical protein